MPGESEQYNLRAIRDLLLDAFDAEELLSHESLVNSVAFSADGKWAVTGGHDNTALVWQAPGR